MAKIRNKITRWCAAGLVLFCQKGEMFVEFVWTKNSLYGRSGNRGYFFTIKSNVEQPNFIVFGAFPTFFADSMNDSLPESGCNHFRAISLPLFGTSDHTGWSRALCNHNIHWFASRQMQLSLAFTCAGLDRQMFIWRGGGLPNCYLFWMFEMVRPNWVAQIWKKQSRNCFTIVIENVLGSATQILPKISANYRDQSYCRLGC